MNELIIDRVKVIWDPLRVVRLNDWESMYIFHAGELGSMAGIVPLDIVTNRELSVR